MAPRPLICLACWRTESGSTALGKSSTLFRVTHTSRSGGGGSLVFQTLGSVSLNLCPLRVYIWHCFCSCLLDWGCVGGCGVRGVCRGMRVEEGVGGGGGCRQ